MLTPTHSFVLDIYAASEPPIEGITGEVLARRICEKGTKTVSYAGSFAEAVALVSAVAEPGDMILTLGAGSVSQIGPMILERLEAGHALPAPSAATVPH